MTIDETFDHKEVAQAVLKQLRAQNSSARLGEAYEVMAKEHGFKSWNAMSAHLKQGKPVQAKLFAHHQSLFERHQSDRKKAEMSESQMTEGQDQTTRDENENPSHLEWWIVHDPETAENVRAQWNADRKFWRIFDGVTLGLDHVVMVRRARDGDPDAAPAEAPPEMGPF